MKRLYELAITLVPFVGNKTAKSLIAYCGGAEAVFKENKKNLSKIPGIGPRIINSIINTDVFSKAEKNLTYFDKHNISTHFYLNDETYPQRLKHYDDSPIILFKRGTAQLNAIRTVGIVGTRKPTSYGKAKTQEIIDDLRAYDVQIISGLAYGIDSIAHNHSVQSNVENLAIMGTGQDQIYPAQNKKLADRIMKNGAIISEFPIDTKPDRENFPLRNRIIAGMSDAIIVIQSAQKGGSLITAEYANVYNKDVFALPGRTSDEMSIGCNQLIKTNKAHLLESAKDLAYIMRWETSGTKHQQTSLFIELSEEEKLILEKIKQVDEAALDWLHHETKMSLSQLANHLLALEFKGIITNLPGKKYGIAG